MASNKEAVWRLGLGTTAGFKLRENEAAMIGSPEHAFYTSKEFGNIIKGPLSVTAAPQQIRIHGFWTLNPLLLSMVPSTIITPVPTLVFNPPLGGLAKMEEAVSSMIRLMVY